MSADIWMPLFIGDYLADTRRLDTEQHGAYLLLIMDYWKNGPPPDNDQTLARIIVATDANWKRLRPIVEPFFHIEDGRWNHKRIDRERARAKENSETFMARARTAAAARWNGKHKPSNASSNASSTRQALLERCPPAPAPAPALEPTLQSASERDREGGANAPARARFEKPSLAMVRLQFAKCGVPETEAEGFIAHYESNGWRVGKNPMKSWVGAVTTWKRNYESGTYSRSQNGPARDATLNFQP